MAKKSLFLFQFFLLPTLFFSQPSIQWQKSLGGTSSEEARCVQQTSDGGYILTGLTESTDGDIIGNHGGGDFWVVKLSITGTIQWEKAYGGSDLDVPYSIQQCIDGGFVLAGTTNSSDGDVTTSHGEEDAWVVKLNNIGDIQWQNSLGGSSWDEAHSIQQTPDGGYIVVGRTSSMDGDVADNHGALDFWVVKLSELGEIQWEKTLGGSSIDIARSIKVTPDGGYIVIGSTSSNDGQVSNNHGNDDYWVVKLTSLGDIEWQKTLGGLGSDIGLSVAVISDGGYFVIGTTGSANSGDVTGYHGLFDCWVAKLNSGGGIEWQRSLGGSEPDYGQSIFLTNDGGCIVAGSTQSEDGDVAGNDGGADLWVVKLTGSGEIKWQKTLGGTQAEYGYSIQQTSDNGYLVGGYSWSSDGDVSNNHGEKDFWVVKLSPESSPTSEIHSLPLEIFPNPASNSISLKIPMEAPSLTVLITDLLGRELSRQTISEEGKVDIAALPNGLYLLMATTPSGKVFSGKFCKQE